MVKLMQAKWLRSAMAMVLVASLVVVAPIGAGATSVMPNVPPLGTTERVSLASDDAQGDGGSGHARISATGEFVVFSSWATNFFPGDALGFSDVFIRDLNTGATELMSAAFGGPANGSSGYPDVSADGRYVVFESDASDIVPGDSGLHTDIFLRDRTGGWVKRISEAGGVEGNGFSYTPVISDDGAYVAFVSAASNLVPGDTNGFVDVFLYDVAHDSLIRITEGPGAVEANSDSYLPSISADGMKVAFASSASNLVDNDSNSADDVFVYTREDGSIQLVSRAGDGTAANGPSSAAEVSASGATVAFVSAASNLVDGDDNNKWDVFVANLELAPATTDSYVKLASTSSEGVIGNGDAWGSISLNEDGSVVAFTSAATNLVANDGNGVDDVFVHFLKTGETRRVSTASDGTEGDLASEGPRLDATGEKVVFGSYATNLVDDDTNSSRDVFLHTLPDFTGPEVFSNLTSMGEYQGKVDIEIWATDASGVATVAWNLDGNGWVHVSGSETTLTVDTVGYHTITYKAIDTLGNYSDYVTAEFSVTRADDVEAPRTAGATRYETAIEASRRAYPDGADNVVIATGTNWPDALGGSALAGAVSGPLLLVDSAAISDAVMAEIRRLGAHHAYILGGTGAVSEAVEAELIAELGDGNVERIAGADRYATASAVADKVLELTWTSSGGHAFVATGGNYPDALAGSPIAAANRWPILLAHPVTGDVDVPEAIDYAVILGGTGAVSAATEAGLKAELGEANVERAGGLSRYETASLVAEFGVEHAGMFWDGVGLATGESFPDALSGGAMLGVFDTVLLLTPTNSLSPVAATVLTAKKQSLDEVNIIGGTGAVAPAVEAQVLSIIE